MNASAEASDPEGIAGAAHAAADAARKPTLRRFRTPSLDIENKAGPGGYDPVTEADREAETAMRETLARLRPADGILGEEHGRLQGEACGFWVLDPIDGTRAYVVGAPTWGVLVGYNDGTCPRYGVMDQPFTQERYWGDGRSAWRGRGENPAAAAEPIRTRRGARLEDAALCTTFPEIGAPDECEAFARVRDKVRLTRYGLDCTAYVLLAAGTVDLVIEAGLAPYDIQALIPIVEGAGGAVTDWTGGDPQNGGRILAAATRELADAALELLAGR